MIMIKLHANCLWQKIQVILILKQKKIYPEKELENRNVYLVMKRLMTKEIDLSVHQKSLLRH